MSNDKDFKVKNGIQPTVYQESLGTIATGSVTVGYDLSVAAYDSVEFSIVSQDTSPRGMTFNNDGTKMYIVGSTNDSVFQYSLSTGFDLSTASYDSVSFSVASQDTTPIGLSFNSDGTKMYIIGSSSNTVYQYSLSTGFNLSTASYDSVSFSVSSQESSSQDLAFNNDGTKMYIVGSGSNTVYQYSLSTGFNLSTASYDSVSFSTASQEGSVRGMTFKSDGTKMYVTGALNDSVYQYSLSTAFDISTATYDNESFSLASQTTAPNGITFSDNGTKLYMVTGSEDKVFQYSTSSTLTTNTLDLSTGSVFEITPTSNIQVGLSNPAASGTVSQATLLLDGGAGAKYQLNLVAADSPLATFDVSAQDTDPRGLFIGDSGTKMYMAGLTGSTVDQYDLSSAWDISTATYTQTSSQSSFTTVTDLFFKPDGTKFYHVEYQADRVYEYSLSTAWDISTLSSVTSFAVDSQGANPQGLAFSEDGTVMIVCNSTNRSVFQYSLSTAWDVSTASYASKSVDVSSYINSYLAGVRFADSGGVLIVSGAGSTNLIVKYTLSTPYDISTATYVEPSASSTQSNHQSIEIKPDGTKFFTFKDNTLVGEYDFATPATITYDSAIQFGGGTAPDSPAIGETDVLAFSTRDGGTSYQAMQAIDGAK